MSSLELGLILVVAALAVLMALAWVRIAGVTRLLDSMVSWPGRIETLERQLRNVPIPPQPPRKPGGGGIREDEWVPPTMRHRDIQS